VRVAGVVKTLGETDENHYLWDVCWYDDKARIVQAVRKTAIGDIVREGIAYDFTGNVIGRYVKHSQFVGTDVTESYSYSYDSWGRPLTTTLSLNDTLSFTLHDYSYDRVGRLIGDSRSDAYGTLVTSIGRTVRSWPSNMTTVTATQDTLFHQEFYYNALPSGITGVQRWNGALSAMRWKARGETTDHTYSYGYDGLGRLTNATFTNGNNADGQVNNRTYQYDKHGNVIQSSRKVMSLPFHTRLRSVTGIMSGNRMSSMVASMTNPNVSTTTTFQWDANGNRTQEAITGQTPQSVGYNLLNLPETVTSGEDTEHYVYSAKGAKLSRTWTRVSTAMFPPVQSHRTDYSENFVYIDSTLYAVLVDGGHILMTGTEPKLRLYTMDQQGNVRVVSSTSGSIREVFHYAPYGETITPVPDAASPALIDPPLFDNPYRFDGKELSSPSNMASIQKDVTKEYKLSGKQLGKSGKASLQREVKARTKHQIEAESSLVDWGKDVSESTVNSVVDIGTDKIEKKLEN